MYCQQKLPQKLQLEQLLKVLQQQQKAETTAKQQALKQWAKRGESHQLKVLQVVCKANSPTCARTCTTV